MGLVPPKKSKWTRGTTQIGVYVRTAMGSVLESCQNNVTREELTWALSLMTGIEKVPPDLVSHVHEEWIRRTGEDIGDQLPARASLSAKSDARKRKKTAKKSTKKRARS